MTAHRIFSYNCTSDLHAVVTHSLEAYPHTKAVAVGFSLGANLVAKYLGERRFTVPANIVGGISICQGYDALMYVSFFFFVVVDVRLFLARCSSGKMAMDWPLFRERSLPERSVSLDSISAGWPEKNNNRLLFVICFSGSP